MTMVDGATRHDCRDAFVDTLLDLVGSDPRVVAVVNDSLGSTKVTKVAKAYPDRVINVGIAEQDLVGIGAGLANGGSIPFVCAASPFLTGRALEQIKVDAAYSAANVKLVGVSSGVAYGELGPTHHSIEDVAWTRAIDGLDRRRAGRPARDEPGHPGRLRARRSHLRAHQPHARAGRARPGLPVPHRPGGPAARRRRRHAHRQRRHGQPRPGGGGRCWPRRASRRAS